MARPVGFFGKVPSKGDFISSNLPGSLLQPWDNWLRLTLARCQERLGEQAKSAFLLSPVWRFILGPGCCGPQAWAGVLASSVDQIGRLYPLTLAIGLENEDAPIALMTGWAAGFERLVDLCLKMVNEHAAIDNFAVAAQLLLDERPLPARSEPAMSTPGVAAELAPGDTLSVTALPEGPEFENACAAAAARAGAQFSLMWRVGWGLPPLAVVGCGLPDTARSATIWEMTAMLR